MKPSFFAPSRTVTGLVQAPLPCETVVFRAFGGAWTTGVGGNCFRIEPFLKDCPAEAKGASGNRLHTVHSKNTFPHNWTIRRPPPVRDPCVVFFLRSGGGEVALGSCVQLCSTALSTQHSALSMQHSVQHTQSRMHWSPAQNCQFARQVTSQRLTGLNTHSYNAHADSAPTPLLSIPPPLPTADPSGTA